MLYIKHEQECFIRIFKHQKVSWKNQAQPRFFDQLCGVRIPTETLYWGFYMASQTDHFDTKKTKE